MRWRDGRRSKEEVLKDFFKYPPGIEGKDQQRQLREARRLWKRELHRYERRKSKNDLRDS